MELIRIGYWAGSASDPWPSVEAFVDVTWDQEERQRVLMHLRQGVLARAYMGFSTCRLCGERNGSIELTDGRFIWPEGLAHYVEVHGVRLPARFVDSVDEIQSCLDDAKVDDSWWRVTRSP
ncbi:MAG: hypothetical protein KDB26_11120 [Microthrixaceae bacterium]|nr:hypothetical protein [Microthrixaceae bacterium]